MDDQATVLQLAVVVAFVAVALGFLIFVQSGGFLALAIERAIEDGRVIVGMTKDDVIRSWGRPSRAETQSIRPLNVDELVAATWIYENRHRTVYFSNDGIVLCVGN